MGVGAGSLLTSGQGDRHTTQVPSMADPHQGRAEAWADPGPAGTADGQVVMGRPCDLGKTLSSDRCGLFQSLCFLFCQMQSFPRRRQSGKEVPGASQELRTCVCLMATGA